MTQKLPFLSKFMTRSAKMTGSPFAFVTALLVVAIWLIIGVIWGLSNTWLLVIDTVATLNATLMVFVIQNTQNRESKALHLKIDELIRASKEAENELIAIEGMEEDELDRIKQKLLRRRGSKPLE